jgi:hypothetical protein
MLINGQDISVYNAKLVDKDIQTADVRTYTNWLSGALNYYVEHVDETYTFIKLVLAVEGLSEEEVLLNISNLVRSTKLCTIKFDNISFYFDCVLDSNTSKYLSNTCYQLEINLKANFKYKDYITEAVSGARTLNIQGNTSSLPALLEVKPMANFANIQINLGGNLITLKNLISGKTYIIDGEKYKVTVDGTNKYGDFDGSFPVLIPGNVNASINTVYCNMNVKYKPRWY